MTAVRNPRETAAIDVGVGWHDPKLDSADAESSPGSLVRPTRVSASDDESPLGRIESAFVNLSRRTRPPPVLLPAALLGGSTDQWMTPFEVRAALLSRLRMKLNLYIDGEHIAQRVWHYIAARARHERGEWLTVAVGMAMNALKATVPDGMPAKIVPLVHSDLVFRMVVLLADTNVKDDDRFDLNAPYLYTRLLDRLTYAATRSPRRATAADRSAPWDEFEAYELARDPDSFRLPRLQLGDPLVVLAGLVRDHRLTRLDAALLARTALCGQSRGEAIEAVRETLPSDVGHLTDEALRGRLERARAAMKTIYGNRSDHHTAAPPG